MYTSLIMLLLALLVGYAIPVPTRYLKRVTQLSGGMLYLILLVMGYHLASIEQLGQSIKSIFVQGLSISLLLAFFNLSALFFIGKWLQLNSFIRTPCSQAHSSALKEAAFLLILLCCGLLLGLMSNSILPLSSHLIDVALLILIGCIGIELRCSGISLTSILLNRRGLIIALTMMLSCIPVALISAYLFQQPIASMMALVSGFGWYSLSAALIGDAHGPVMGSIALICDLSRELLCLLLMPWLMSRSAPAAIGYAGATAMDISLPILQRAGGNTVVPIAIASGFILSVTSPLLILFFLSFA